MILAASGMICVVLIVLSILLAVGVLPFTGLVVGIMFLALIAFVGITLVWRWPVCDTITTT